MVAHLWLGEQVVSLIARVPRSHIIVYRLWPLTRDDLHKVSKGQGLVWISQLLIVHLQQQQGSM